MPSRIFISHSSRDRDMAYRMIADLEKRGIPCWISSRDIEPGDDYQKSIVDALNASPAMVLLFSDHANNSKEIPREMAIASDKNKPVIPVRIEDVVPKHALAYSLTNAQFLDLFANFDETMDRLADKLRRQIVASELQLGQPPFSGQPDIPGEPAIVTPPRAKSSAAKPRPVEPATPQTASKAVGSRKKVYAGLGAVVLLAAVGGAALTFKSHDDAPPTAHQTTTPPIAPTPKAPAPQAAPVAENSAGPVAAKPVAETKTDASLGALVDRVRQLSPGDRVNALQSSPLLDSGKLSPAQLTSLLAGSTNSARARLIGNLLPYLQQPVSVDDALKMVNGTGDSWPSAVENLLQALPNALSDTDVLALLGPTSNSRRASLLDKLSGKAQGPFDITVAANILRPMGDSRSGAVQTMVDVLPHPLPETAFEPLLQTIKNSARARTIDALMPAMDTLVTLNGALILLQSTGDSWVSALSSLAAKLPDNLTPAQATQLLGSLSNSSRGKGLAAIAPHLASGLKGDDLASILRGTGDSWYSGVVLLAPHLAPGQDANSVATLLGATSGNTRARAVEALAGVLPEKLTVEDGLKILNGTGDSRLSAAQLLAPHLPHLSQNDVDAITAGMGNTQRRTFVATAGH